MQCAPNKLTYCVYVASTRRAALLNFSIYQEVRVVGRMRFERMTIALKDR